MLILSISHILEGLIIAIENIEEIIKIIKTSKSVSDAKASLRAKYALSEKQAQAIMDPTNRTTRSI